jgi:AMP deaminase
VFDGDITPDSVDDESRPESGVISPSYPLPAPDKWKSPENPPYGYWMYYMYANITTLNKLR